MLNAIIMSGLQNHFMSPFSTQTNGSYTCIYLHQDMHIDGFLKCRTSSSNDTLYISIAKNFELHFWVL